MGTKPWRDRISKSLLAAPFGLTFALLLYTISIVIDRDPDSFSQLELSSPPPLLLEIERALSAVDASMVELPDQDEAHAIAKLTNNARISSLQSRQLTAAVHKLEARYASLVEAYEGSLAERQESMDQMRSELRRLRDQQEVILAQVGMLIVERGYAMPPKESERGLGTGGHHLNDEPARLERTSYESPTLASAIHSNFASDPGNGRSWDPETSLSLPSPIFAALQIARGLEDTRREAMRSKREQRFTVDVERRILGGDPGRESMQLDRVLNLSLDTASSEVINEHSGRILFFPDGSSTGGRIQLRHGKDGAIVNVDWSSGAVTVQVLGDDNPARNKGTGYD